MSWLSILPWLCRSSTRTPQAHPAPDCPCAGFAGSRAPPGGATRPLPISNGLGVWQNVNAKSEYNGEIQSTVRIRNTKQLREVKACSSSRRRHEKRIKELSLWIIYYSITHMAKQHLNRVPTNIACACHKAFCTFPGAST